MATNTVDPHAVYIQVHVLDYGIVAAVKPVVELNQGGVSHGPCPSRGARRLCIYDFCLSDVVLDGTLLQLRAQVTQNCDGRPHCCAIDGRSSLPQSLLRKGDGIVLLSIRALVDMSLLHSCVSVAGGGAFRVRSCSFC